MPTLPKFKKAKPGKSKGGAIVSAQRELLAKQHEIEAQIKALQASLEQTPAAAAQPGRRQYAHRTTLTGVPQTTVVSMLPRRPAPRRPTMLRAERNAARRQTMALVVFLTGAVIYALSHLLP